ncbi:hypothetical protein [Fulvimarina sp. MAC8]|uniref:hypothetical protein n=1 Tax=Fulvimarina sp. MAC8 TaxID=3162874 RepID=UPI0032EBC62E
MNHHATPTFWKAYEALPSKTQRLADRSFKLMKTDPSHPSLHFKPVGRFWSSRVGLRTRALAVRQGDDCIWFWIGTHADYDKLLER